MSNIDYERGSEGVTPFESLTISILDVGHGNCTVIKDDCRTVLIDTGRGAPILEYLRTETISNIDTVVLSHADQDHIGGLIAILASSEHMISEVVLNSDAAQSSSAWRSLAYAIDDARRRHDLDVHIGIHEGQDIVTGIKEVTVTALAPRQRLAILGAGSTDDNGRKITTNTVSAVIAVRVLEQVVVLLPGDIDAVGFEHLKESSQDLSATYLVLPHHGGSTGRNAHTKQMILELCRLVSPEQVFVSNGRGKFDNPRPEVIASVREAIPAAKIACTQLSERCSAELPLSDMSHLYPLYADGRAGRACCAGTICLTNKSGFIQLRDTEAHERFIDMHAPGALCRINQAGMT